MPMQATDGAVPNPITGRQGMSIHKAPCLARIPIRNRVRQEHEHTVHRREWFKSHDKRVVNMNRVLVVPMPIEVQGMGSTIRARFSRCGSRDRHGKRCEESPRECRDAGHGF